MVKIVLRERESVQEAVRRFRKLLDRTGLKRELQRRERYEKPSDVKRKAKIVPFGRRRGRLKPGDDPAPAIDFQCFPSENDAVICLRHAWTAESRKLSIRRR